MLKCHQSQGPIFDQYLVKAVAWSYPCPPMGHELIIKPIVHWTTFLTNAAHSHWTAWLPFILYSMWAILQGIVPFSLVGTCLHSVRRPPVCHSSNFNCLLSIFPGPIPSPSCQQWLTTPITAILAPLKRLYFIAKLISTQFNAQLMKSAVVL